MAYVQRDIDRHRKIAPAARGHLVWLEAVEMERILGPTVHRVANLAGVAWVDDSHKIKTPSSVESKLSRVPEGLNDSLRYTFVYDYQNYTKNLLTACAQFIFHGLDEERRVNYWTTSNEPTAGVSSTFVSESGFRFQVLHETADLHVTMAVTQPMYARRRACPAESDEARALLERQRALIENVPVPSGVEHISSFGRYWGQGLAPSDLGPDGLLEAESPLRYLRGSGTGLEI